MFNPLKYLSKIITASPESEGQITVFSPLTGTMIPLSRVEDATFADKLVGDGFAVNPTEGRVLSPIDGVVSKFFKTKHAICVRSPQGIEILIHVGLDTVSLKGKRFESQINEGDKVSVGDELLTFDIENISKAVPSLVTPVVVTNFEKLSYLEPLLKEGDDLIGAETATLLLTI